LGKQSLKGFSPDDFVDDPITIIAVHGGFYGASLPAAQIEALIAAHVPRQHILEATEVIHSRWWDYRRLSPGHAFYLFADTYYKGCKLAARKFLAERKNSHSYQSDKSRAYNLVGASLGQMTVEEVWTKDQAHITGLWKAMLVADAIGMPYDLFVRVACNAALIRLWKNLPRPSQLYSDTLVFHIMSDWDEIKKLRSTLAKHPLYSEENYVGLPIQDEYRHWLIESIKEQKDKLNALMVAVYHMRHIPEAMALQHFPPHLVNRARLMNI